MSQYLTGKRARTPEERSMLFRNANRLHKEAKVAGGAAWEAVVSQGQMGTLSARAGGFAFGIPLSLAPPPSLVGGPCAGDHVGAVVGREVGGVVCESPTGPKGDAMLRELCEWSAAQPTPRTLASLPAYSADAGAHAVPVAPPAAGEPALSHVVWAPPGRALAERALSAASDSPEGNALKHNLGAAWAALHAPIRADTLNKLGPSTQASVKVCFLAGFCTCGRSGSRLRAFCQSLTNALRQILLKGTCTRQLYDRGALVLQVHSSVPEEEQQLSQQSLWLHVGYGNLNLFHFSFWALQRERGTPRARTEDALGRIALVAVGLPGGC